MIDLLEKAATLDKDLPPIEEKRILCETLLEELKKMDAVEFEKCVAEMVVDLMQVSQRITLRFPICLSRCNPVRREEQGDAQLE